MKNPVPTTPDDVSASLHLLAESLEEEEKRIRNEGSKAMKEGDYDTATAVIDFAKRLLAFQKKVAGLEKAWDDLEDLSDKASALLDAASGLSTRRGNESRKAQAYIHLDPEFLTLMQDADFRRSARIILVETYFPPAERIALYALLGVRAQTLEFQKELHLLTTDTAAQAVEQGRSARFGVQVVCGYQHTCALTGYRIITQNGESVVEAAHIEPWAKTRNDDIHNGLALSRNVHWAFDRGLWSVDDPVDNQYPVLIKPERFEEWGPDDLGLATYRGRMLQFAPQATLRPRAEYLRRHRQQWGF